MIPYTREALKMIIAGASAEQLGWSQAMYESVCRRNAIPIIPASAAMPLATVPAPPPPAVPLENLKSWKPRARVETTEVSVRPITFTLRADLIARVQQQASSLKTTVPNMLRAAFAAIDAGKLWSEIRCAGKGTRGHYVSLTVKLPHALVGSIDERAAYYEITRSQLGRELITGLFRLNLWNKLVPTTEPVDLPLDVSLDRIEFDPTERTVTRGGQTIFLRGSRRARVFGHLLARMKMGLTDPVGPNEIKLHIECGSISDMGAICAQISAQIAPLRCTIEHVKRRGYRLVVLP